MLHRFSLKRTLLLFIGDVSLTLLAIYLAKQLRLTLPFGIDILREHITFPWVIYPTIALIWAVVFLILPVYDPKQTYRAVDDLQITAVGVGFATLVFAGVAYFFFRELSRFLFLYFFILDLSFLLGLRMVLRATRRIRRGRWASHRPRIVILGAGRVGRRLVDLIYNQGWSGIEVVGFLDDNPALADSLGPDTPYLGTLDETVEVVQAHNVDEVIMALPMHAYDRLVSIVHRLQNHAVRVRVVPDLFELSFIKTTVENFEGIPLIGLRDPVMSPFQRVVKRGFDITTGVTGLILGLPLMLVVAILIKWEDPAGPVLFIQDRVGENGRLFKMYKFRSMVVDAEKRLEEIITRTENGDIIHKQVDDPRVTRIGKFIRRTSLDELPQLINVVKGDMSLVGPRPELPWLVDLYEPWQYKRFSVPQGITGWWQVNGRSDKPMHLHVDEDIYYIQHYSLLLDVLILWRTLGAVFKRSGAF